MDNEKQTDLIINFYENVAEFRSSQNTKLDILILLLMIVPRSLVIIDRQDHAYVNTISRAFLAYLYLYTTIT